MTIHRPLGLLLASVLATSAAAQSASRPLNLKLPPGAVPATSGSAAKPASASTAPGVYYGDTSGKPSRRDADEAVAADDGKAKVWGSFTTGIGHTKGYGTSHYNAAEVNVSKSFGDGERPNAFNLQIRVEQGDGPAFGGPYPYPYFDRGAGYPPR